MEDEVSYKGSSKWNQFPWADFYVLLSEIEKLFLWECRFAGPPLQTVLRREMASNKWALGLVLHHGRDSLLCGSGARDGEVKERVGGYSGRARGLEGKATKCRQM